MNDRCKPKLTQVINLWCKSGEHDQCPGYSRGTKADPESFRCLCQCHRRGDADDHAVTRARLRSLQYKYMVMPFGRETIRARRRPVR